MISIKKHRCVPYLPPYDSSCQTQQLLSSSLFLRLLQTQHVILAGSLAPLEVKLHSQTPLQTSPTCELFFKPDLQINSSFHCWTEPSVWWSISYTSTWEKSQQKTIPPTSFFFSSGIFIARCFLKFLVLYWRKHINAIAFFLSLGVENILLLPICPAGTHCPVTYAYTLPRVESRWTDYLIWLNLTQTFRELLYSQISIFIHSLFFLLIMRGYWRYLNSHALHAELTVLQVWTVEINLLLQSLVGTVFWIKIIIV